MSIFIICDHNDRYCHEMAITCYNELVGLALTDMVKDDDDFKSLHKIKI